MHNLLGITKEELEFIDMVDNMTTDERRELRELILKTGGEDLLLPRNLYYNYQTQEWI